MNDMFTDALIFNQNIVQWNASNVTNMAFMFQRAAMFDQNLTSWNVQNANVFNKFAKDASFANESNKWLQFTD